MTAGIPLLETKLYLPQWTTDRVSRPMLIDRIYPKRKLTLISAPAGFGKTTLLSEWISALPKRSVAWVSLDRSDNTPASFWTYVITALQSIQPNIGKRALSLVQSSQPPEIEAILLLLLNELTVIKADVALVLDDYHSIETQAIHDGIGFFLSHLPTQVHLIIASRADPPLSLARLRSHGELTELRVSDLRFTPDEAAAFLNQGMGLEISVGDVAALEQRTEGWIAGLQLAALSLQGREDVSDFVAAFSGDDRYIVDYLLEEVLQRQPDRVRHFLLQTSLLDRLSGSLCDAVTGQNNGQSMLETLERGNLFIIPLDNKRQWYRYHHLFADVLQAHALKECPEQMPVLHGQASKWYEQNELFSDAIRHALAAKDFEHAAGLIEQVWPAMRNRQQERTVLGWLKALPDLLIRVRPILSVAYAIALLNTGQIDSVEDRLQDAEHALTAVKNSEVEQQYRSLPATIANARAFHAQALGDFAGAIAHAEQALALLPSEDDSERGVTASFLGLAYWTSGDAAAAYQSFAEGLKLFQKMGSVRIAICATSVLAQMGLAQGWLQVAIAACHQALQLADQQPEPILQGTADLYLVLSELYYEQGHLDTAHQLLQTGEELRKQGSTSGFDYFLWLVKAQLKAAEGDLDKALEQLQKAAQLYRRSPLPNIRPIEALMVRWWLQQGRLAIALSWLEEISLSVDDKPDYLREYEHLTLARVLIVQYRRDSTNGVIDPVISLLSRLLSAAEAKNRTGSVIKILVVLALANEAQGDLSAALSSLERALTLGEPEGHVRIFAECGPPMARLLQEAMTLSITPAYTQQLLTALKTWGEKPNVPSPFPLSPTPQPLIEPLSQRELDVLRLLNTELSGPEIAGELVVALSTVRTHTKRIYSKLNVTNRRAAVKRATELDLI
ncbi:atp-dependent transcriptional regulator [Leptolyngbya sp. Heron Island J]|uniref:LuxR C-terminal-related transcriptional regulator n=1 Tax=Leptolyngbya sp. Heron Island J TaxID=1385935 RepID=UPI0003B951E4|nr:LuxR C-terminal-related transcriptional regulator [Leptolyngbya sp. Heron Island J]ESA35301.1 atp-dependent transcriptional regulator [Leptolyngbya sp. Heron Island J]